MSDPSPEEVGGYFADPNFPVLPPSCGVPHPDREGVFCDKPVDKQPCYAFHRSTTFDTRLGVQSVTWDNEAMPPKRESNPKRVQEIADAVDAPPPPPVNESLREALARVAAHANPDFNSEAKAVLEVVARHMEEFTAEDVLERVQATTHDNRAMGPVMIWGKNQGLMEKTERFSVYRKESNHQQDTRIWRSLIYQAPVAQSADADASKASPEMGAGSSPAGGTSSVTIDP